MPEEKKTILDISKSYFKDEKNIYGYRKATSSWRLVDWVIKYSNLKGHSKLVAAQVASYYGYHKGYSYPSYERLQHDTGLSRSTIARAIVEMKKSGEWIVVSKGTKTGRKVANEYYPISPVSVENLQVLTTALEEQKLRNEEMKKEIEEKKKKKQEKENEKNMNWDSGFEDDLEDPIAESHTTKSEENSKEKPKVFKDGFHEGKWKSHLRHETIKQYNEWFALKKQIINYNNSFYER